MNASPWPDSFCLRNPYININIIFTPNRNIYMPHKYIHSKIGRPEKICRVIEHSHLRGGGGGNEEEEEEKEERMKGETRLNC